MALGFLDGVKFLAASAGTGPFVVSSAVQGFQAPAAAGALDGTVYRYRAESSDLSQWEIGYSPWSAATSSLPQRNVLFSSNGNALVNFTNAPNVGMVQFGEDVLSTSPVASPTAPAPIVSRAPSKIAVPAAALISLLTLPLLPFPLGVGFGVGTPVQEAVRLDTSGNLNAFNTYLPFNWYVTNLGPAAFQVANGNINAFWDFAVGDFNAQGAGSQWATFSTRSRTPGVWSAALSGDVLWSLFSYGDTGASAQTGARIASIADAAWTATSAPARWTFWTAPSGSATSVERWRIDSAGNLISGAHALVWAGPFEINNISGSTNISLLAWNSAGNAPQIWGGYSRGTAIGTQTAVTANDALLNIFGLGSDGTALRESSLLQFFVNGTVSANTVPGGMAISLYSAGFGLAEVGRFTTNVRGVQPGALWMNTTVDEGVNTSANSNALIVAAQNVNQGVNLTLEGYGNYNFGVGVLITRSRGAAPGTRAILQANDDVGNITWCADLGVAGPPAFADVGYIDFAIDNVTPTSTSMPGLFTVGVTANGATACSIAFTIDSSLRAHFYGPIFINQGATTPQVALDASSTGVAIAAGANVPLQSRSGIIMVCDAQTTGDVGIYRFSGATGTLIGTANTWVAPTTTPASGKMSVAWNGSAPAVYNGQTVATTFRVTHLAT